LGTHGLIPVPLDFGSFGARQLIWKPARKKKLQWLLDEYTKECDRLRCQSPSIVAHSFGCYLVAGLMRKYSQVRFDRIIFCGSIVHPDYPWATLAARGQVKSVLNQYGGEDFWAWVVQWGVEDAGPSGYAGFGKPPAMLHQQNHPEFAHSDYFFDLNYNQSWIPFLLGKPVPSVTAPAGGWETPVNWRFRVVLAIALLLCLAALLSAGWYVRSRLQKQTIQVTQVPQYPQTSVPQPFSGFVQDDSGAPLPGVTITAPTLNVPPQETDQYGRFSFRIDLPAGTNFRVIFEKPGFETYSADPPAGDTTFNIPLHKATAKRNP
jgi:hypothetical protein